MIAKTKCPHCQQIHNVEFVINPDNFLEECASDQDYVISIFKCLVFPDVFEQKDENQTIKDAKAALSELERDFLNQITEFEEKFGVTVQGIETNLSKVPAWKRRKETHTNSLILYGDL